MYINSKNVTDFTPPKKLKPSPKLYVPHSFSEEELKRFFFNLDTYEDI